LCLLYLSDLRALIRDWARSIKNAMHTLTDKDGGGRVVAIVGASGYIGRHIVAELRRLGGYKIKLLARSLNPNPMETDIDAIVEVFKGDLQQPESLYGFFEPNCTVINLVYLWGAAEMVNLQVAANLIKACKAAKVKRLIHCSTAAVVGRATDDLITEDTPCRPVTEYGVTKLKVEQAIIGAGQGCFDVVILRPTSVFGPEGDPLKKLAGDIVSGSRFGNYLKSCLFGKRRMNLVSVANVVSAIIFMIQREENLGGEIFAVSNDDSPANNFSDVEKFLMRAFKIDGYLLPRIPMPLSVLTLLLKMMGRNNINPRCNYASNKLRHLGFEPVVTFETALAEYAAWYLSSHLS
jgi:nucleoside-diphosphate-sugar epimerase